MKITITFRHFVSFLLLSACIQFVAQAQIAGPINVTVNGPIGAGWSTTYPKNYTFTFSYNANEANNHPSNLLPGLNEGTSKDVGGSPGGRCTFLGSISTLSSYEANVTHTLPTSVESDSNIGDCNGQKITFKWTGQAMPTPIFPDGTNSICSGSSFRLSTVLPPNSKITRYYWYRRKTAPTVGKWETADGQPISTYYIVGSGGPLPIGVTPGDTVFVSPFGGRGYASTSNTVTLTAQADEAATYEYIVEGYRNGRRVAPLSGSIPVFMFPAAPDEYTTNPQSSTWVATESIPLTLNGSSIGAINITHNNCNDPSKANAKINITFDQNVVGNYYYSLAAGSDLAKPNSNQNIFTTDAVMNITPTQLSHTFPNDVPSGDQFPLIAGDYTLAIENIVGGQRYCYGKYLIKIKSPSAVTLTQVSTQNPTCIGGNNGQIVLNTGGGAAATSTAYTYTILKYRDNILEETRTGLGAGNHTFGGLNAADYRFEVQESGCGSGTLATVGTISLTNPPTTTASAAIATPIVCEGGTGSIRVNLNTGNESGTYSIEAYKDGASTPHATATGIAFATTKSHTFTGLPAGSYTFVVKHSCGSSSNATVSTPVVLVDLVPVAGTLAGIKQAGSTHEISCKGNTDGKIGVKVTAGNAIAPNTAYTLVLKQGGTVVTNPAFVGIGTTALDNVTVGDSVVFTGLAETSYSVEISQNNCTHPAKVLGSVSLSAPVAMSASVTPVVRFGSHHVSCANGEDGQIRVDNIAGGNGGYTIALIENGSQIASQTGTSALFTGLRPASFQGGSISYTIQITDSKSCTYTNTLQLSAPPALAAVLTPQRVTCKGESNGSVSASISGGTMPYTIQWVDGTGTALTPELTLGASESSHTLSNRPAGTYTLRVKDSQGCHNFVSGGWYETSATVDEPAIAFAFDVPAFIIDSVSCNGGNDGRISLAVVGGWGGYAYSKDGTNFQASASFAGFTAGDHTLYARDAENCIISTVVSVKEPLPLTLTQQQITHVSCKGGYNGIYVFEAKGGNDAGTQPYTILINGAAYAETDWSEWSSNHQITLRGLAAANYSIQATDAKGCAQTLSFTITEPALLEATVGNIVAASCGLPNGSASVAVSGGTTPYSYTWKKYDAALGTLKTWSTSASLAGAESGAYEMIVTDALGCSVTQVVQLSNADAAKVQSQSVTPVSCAEAKDGSATFSVTGDFPITVTWVGDNSGQIAWQNTSTLALSGLTKGYHDFQTRDAKGCIRFERVLVPGPEPLLISRTSSQDPTCHNGNDGSLSIAISGGTAPYTIQWDSGLAANATSFTNLGAGTYTAIVSDDQGCTRQASFVLQNPLPISVDLGTGSTVCVGQSVTLKPTIPAGNTVASYAWSSASGNFNSTASEVTVSTADTYFLTITTTAGCSGSGEYQLQTSADAFEADFLMPSDAVVGDTVVLIEICRPKPTTLFWDIEGIDQTVTSLESTVTNPKQRLIFSEPGTYTVRLYASAGNCQDVHERQVTVKKGDGQRSGQAAQTGHAGQQISAQVSPNPVSNGKFNIEVHLAKAAPVKVDIVNISSGNRWRYPHPLTGKGKTDYNWQLDIPQLTHGVYAVRIQTPTAQKIVKVVVE